MVNIEWTKDAIKDFEKLDRQIVSRILKKVNWLSLNFEHLIPEPLLGEFKGTFKLRIGDWRVIYTIEGNTIVIQFVGHRREIYKI